MSRRPIPYPEVLGAMLGLVILGVFWGVAVVVSWTIHCFLAR